MLNLCKSPRGIVVSAAMLFFLFSATVYGQKAAEWRPISPADLQATKPVVEPDADAEALIWETRIDDSSDDKLTRKNYVRIKIFTERGREKFAKVDIPFLKGSTKIKNIAARVIKPDGSSVVLADKDIFEREVIRQSGVKVRAKSFAVPNIEPGVIVEYQYTESNEDDSFIGGRFYLQRDVPVRELVYFYKPYNSKDPVVEIFNTTGQGFVKDEHGFYRLSRTNVPAYKEERYMPPDDMVKPYAALKDTGYSLAIADGGLATMKWDRSNQTKYWGAFAGYNSRRVAFWIDQADSVKKAVQAIIAGAANDEEKLRRIYDYCQKLKNISYETAITDDQYKNVAKQSTKDILKAGPAASATSSQINGLFGSMVIAADFQTYAAFSSRRDEVFFEPKMTDRDLLSFAGVMVLVGDTPRTFNPGIKFAGFGQLPWYRENAPALAVNTRSNAWFKLQMTAGDKNLTKRTAKLKLAEDGSLEGTVAIELHGQAALTYRMSNYDDELTKREQNLIDSIHSRISNAEITNVSMENFDDNSKPVIQRYTIKIPNYAQKTGKRMFFQPGIFEYGAAAKFASSTRQYDIAFSYPWSENDEVEITYPSTYAIDSGEAPGDVNAGEISKDVITIDRDDAASKLSYHRKFYFGNASNLTFNVSAYAAVKELWDMIQKTDTATLSIKQK